MVHSAHLLHKPQDTLFRFAAFVSKPSILVSTWLAAELSA